MPLTLTDAHPTARKQHRCDDCRRLIERGEQYRRWSGIGDDGPYTWKTCEHCQAVCDYIQRVEGTWPWDDGLDLELWMADTDDPQLVALRAAFRSGWAEYDAARVAGALAPAETGEKP